MAEVITNKKLKELLNSFPDEAGVIVRSEDLVSDCDDGCRNINRVIETYIEEDNFDIPTIIIQTKC